MSEASKAAALAHAAMVHQGSGDPVATLESAEAFHAFITGGTAETEAKAAPAKTAAKAPAKTVAPTPAKKAVKPPVEDDAEDEPAEGDVSKEDVGAAVEALLNANLRAQVIKLYAKYGAKSLSGVKADDYAAIKQDAEDLLLNA